MATALALTLLLAQVAPASALAKSEYRLYAGTQHPGETMTANVLTAGRLALRGVDAAIEPLQGPIAIAMRGAVFLLVDLPILSYTIVVPHELFGHWTRHREFGGTPEVHFDLPLPYSLNADHFVARGPSRFQYPGEESVEILGGLQAQEASQRMLTATTFRTGVLRRGEAMIYATTTITHVSQTMAGGDLHAAAQRSFGAFGGDPTAYRWTARGALLLDAVDPMLLYSLYTSVISYGIRGKRSVEAPSIELAGARWLATSRTLPVPWGVEHQLHLLAAWPWASFDLGVRTGVGARESFGAELATFDWRFLRVMRVGGELAMWIQPFVSSFATLGPSPVVPSALAIRDRTTVGGAARLVFEVDRPSWMLGTRLGYKTAGLWGERELASGFEVALTGGFKL